MSYFRSAYFVAAALTACLLAGCRAETATPVQAGDVTTTTTATTTSTATATTTVTEASDSSLPTLTEDDTFGNDTFFVCDDHAAIMTDVTSCPFAVNVAKQYGENPHPTLRAYSPKTEMTYLMKCQSGFSAKFKDGRRVDATKCEGGNNAVVMVY